MNAIYAAHFAPYKPARSCVEVSLPSWWNRIRRSGRKEQGRQLMSRYVQVAKLPLGVLVEIEAIATFKK